jgi:hypothetical protein
MKDHTLYLKALTKGDKNKTIESEEFKRDLERLTKEYAPHSKPLSRVEDERAGRKFILENLEEFLRIGTGNFFYPHTPIFWEGVAHPCIANRLH